MQKVDIKDRQFCHQILKTSREAISSIILANLTNHMNNHIFFVMRKTTFGCVRPGKT